MTIRHISCTIEVYADPDHRRRHPGLCFVDTLDLHGHQRRLGFNEENTERGQREQNAAITVIIGNPPYNVGQKNENDNNKNRPYRDLDQHIKDTYAQDSAATNKKALSDAYVRFFRWATDRLQGQDGIVCLVTNNSFVDQAAFDGVRKHLLQDFTQVYHIDLHGNVRKNPKLSGTTHNVFGIQVGVGITVAVRRAGAESFLKYHRVPENWRKEEKLRWLTHRGDLSAVDWQTLTPNAKNIWLTDGMQEDYDAFLPLGTKDDKVSKSLDVKAIFKNYSLGVVTNRDDWVYDFDAVRLGRRVAGFVSAYSGEVMRWLQSGKPADVDGFVLADDTKIKWSRDLKNDLRRGRLATFDEGHIQPALYRPFSKRCYFFDPILSQDIFLQPRFFPASLDDGGNRAICVTDLSPGKPFMTLLVDCVPDLHLVGAGAATQCFPLYTYALDGRIRRENITDWALGEFRARYGPDVTKRDIFHYVYGLLHSPGYRERYRENLKRELPRIPLVGPLAPNNGGTGEDTLSAGAGGTGEATGIPPAPPLSGAGGLPSAPSWRPGRRWRRCTWVTRRRRSTR